MAGKRVLVVEDNLMLAETYVDLLSMDGFHVLNVATTAEEAVSTAQSEKPDLVLVDVSLRGHMDGIDAAGAISGLMDVPFIFISGTGNGRDRARMAALGNHAFLMKPVDFDDLKQKIRELLQ